jgi:hypothetical protein
MISSRAPRVKKHSQNSPEIELRPDGWERFKTAVAAAVKSGPKHRPSLVRQSKPKQSESLSDRARLDIDVHREKSPKKAAKGKKYTHKNARLSKPSRF